MRRRSVSARPSRRNSRRYREAFPAGILTDGDGSEALSFVITLPPGVTPSVGTFIGNGWSVTPAQLASLTIPAPANFSGNYADWAAAQGGAPFSVRVVNQENDGDQRATPLPVTITITPVTDGAAAWSHETDVNEGAAISLAGLVSSLSRLDGATIATNPGETVQSITVDFIRIFTNRFMPRASQLAFDVASFIATHIGNIGGVTVNGDGTVTGTRLPSPRLAFCRALHRFQYRLRLARECR